MVPGPCEWRGQEPGRALLNWVSLNVRKSDMLSKKMHDPEGFMGEFRY